MIDELRDGNVHANLGLACVVSLRDRVHEQVEHLCGPEHNLLVSSSPVVMVATRSWPAVIVASSSAAVVTVMTSVVAEIIPLISPQDNESWRAALR